MMLKRQKNIRFFVIIKGVNREMFIFRFTLLDFPFKFLLLCVFSCISCDRLLSYLFYSSKSSPSTSDVVASVVLPTMTELAVTVEFPASTVSSPRVLVVSEAALRVAVAGLESSLSELPKNWEDCRKEGRLSSVSVALVTGAVVLVTELSRSDVVLSKVVTVELSSNCCCRKLEYGARNPRTEFRSG